MYVHVGVWTPGLLFEPCRTVINPWRMRSEGYSTWSVCLCVCLSVTTFSATTHNKAAKKRYQRLQYSIGKMVIFVKVLCSSYGVKKPIC